MLPEDVKKYVIFFYREFFKANNSGVIESLYEAGHKRLSDKYFGEQAQSWPSGETIAPLVEKNAVFLLFYKELFFRHVYAKSTPSIEQRLDSYANYIQLFKALLGGCFLMSLFPESKDVGNLDLPEKWLWEIVDEFIYQVSLTCALPHDNSFKHLFSTDSSFTIGQTPKRLFCERIPTPGM
jgi:translation initiation factor 3 subunit L